MIKNKIKTSCYEFLQQNLLVFSSLRLCYILVHKVSGPTLSLQKNAKLILDTSSKHLALLYKYIRLTLNAPTPGIKFYKWCFLWWSFSSSNFLLFIQKIKFKINIFKDVFLRLSWNTLTFQTLKKNVHKQSGLGGFQCIK